MKLQADLAFIIAVLGLATYRISFMVANEEGPFSIFERLRVLMGAYDQDETGKPPTIWGRGISCPLCVGFWVSLALLFGILIQFYTVWEVFSFNAFVLWMGIAGIQVFLNSLNYRN